MKRIITTITAVSFLRRGLVAQWTEVLVGRTTEVNDNEQVTERATVMFMETEIDSEKYV